MRTILIAVLMTLAAQAGATEFLLYAEDNEFLGCWGCGEYSSDSICFEYGTYGGEYSNSIWNEYGTYGSEYSSESPWNEYSNRAPKLFDTVGNYYDRFSINIYAGFDLSENLKRLYEAANGNLALVRKGLCD